MECLASSTKSAWYGIKVARQGDTRFNLNLGFPSQFKIKDKTIGYFGIGLRDQMQCFQHGISTVYNDSSADTRLAKDRINLYLHMIVKFNSIVMLQNMVIGDSGVNLTWN